MSCDAMEYGPAVTHAPEKSCSLYGVEGSVAANQFIAITDVSEGNGLVSLTISLFPVTDRPEILLALPS